MDSVGRSSQAKSCQGRLKGAMEGREPVVDRIADNNVSFRGSGSHVEADMQDALRDVENETRREERNRVKGGLARPGEANQIVGEHNTSRAWLRVSKE
ncbi:unnamed protein product [Sphagnum balticum]